MPGTPCACLEAPAGRLLPGAQGTGQQTMAPHASPAGSQQDQATLPLPHRMAMKPLPPCATQSRTQISELLALALALRTLARQKVLSCELWQLLASYRMHLPGRPSPHLRCFLRYCSIPSRIVGTHVNARPVSHRDGCNPAASNARTCGCLGEPLHCTYEPQIDCR